MDAPPGAPTEIPVPLDAAATEVVRLAAHLGAQGPDDVFVSYTTLLLGLLFARLDLPAQTLASGVTVSTAPAWHVEANRALRVDRILREKSLPRDVAEQITAQVASGELQGWPSGRPLLSVSATNVLHDAGYRAGASGTAPAMVTPADIMASYLLTIPEAHRMQAESWRLSAPPGQRIAALLTRPAWVEPEPGDLPAYDRGAGRMLRIAFALAARRRGQRRPLIDSRALLVAVVESVPQLDPPDTVEAEVLRGMIGAEDEGSAYRRQRGQAFDLPDLAEAARAATTDWPPLSQNAQRILETAREVAQRMSGSTVVGARHLVAAVVSEPDGTDRLSGSGSWLGEFGVDSERLREALARVIAGWHGSDDQAAWHRLLIGGGTRLIAVARPDTIPDDPRAEDSLDLRRYADAIGALISAGDQRPPLSIAVFGSWGSGKSYFMAMIRAAVRDFEASGIAAHATQAPSPFLRRVVQIEFNAWHYAEGNLWASLVHAILVGLQRAMTPEADRSPFQDVLDKLHLHEAARIEAEAKLREAEQRLEETRAALAKAEEEAETRRTREDTIPTAADILRGVQEETLAALRPAGDGTDPKAWIRTVGSSVQQAAEYLGRRELAAQVPALQAAAEAGAATEAAMRVKVAEIRELLDEAKASTDRGLSLLSWLANARLPEGGLLKTALSGVAVLLALLVVALLLERHGAAIAAWITGAAALLAPLLGAATAALGWARRHLADATRAFAVLGSIRERVEARQAGLLAARDAELLAARRATAEAEAEAARRRAELEAARVAVAKAQEELTAATSPERLKRFVAQRLAEGDYQRHLGLIHTIRSDLERLEDILRGVHPREAELRGEAPVQRIVLYIDDLDRCPPARVVEVLEAVHLLLAFKLFVVVVGVDVRWVAQALRDRYPLQLGYAPGIASPMDYLEKVFQIPFWLPAMDAGAGRRLLESAVGPVSSATATAPAGVQQTGGGGGTPDEPEGKDAAAEQAEAAAMQPEATPGGVAPKVTVADTQAAAEALALGEAERECLLGLAAAVGASPRRAKRFANLYRLLKASLSPAERRGFVLSGGKAGSYEAALLLLAATTGAPHAARALIEALGDAPAPEGETWLEDRFAHALPAVPPPEQAAFAAARERALAAKDGAAMAAHLQFWASRVTRFVFDGHTPRVPTPAPDHASAIAAPKDAGPGQPPAKRATPRKPPGRRKPLAAPAAAQ
ncbi:P-loop NTPase fold protein [Falsiroseomonas sp.]|uniref:P-loop NTPase fold protein n=1 Tax=Falsiroseomonas sp. TaxID=2870721 RepID=UPI00356769E0